MRMGIDEYAGHVMSRRRPLPWGPRDFPVA
jgi:hypothetical protein